MATVQTSPRDVRQLTGSLLTQVETRDVQDLRVRTDQPGGGMVLSGPDALNMVEYLQGRGYHQPLLADRQRYKGSKRAPAAHPFDAGWINRQRRYRLPVIVPDAGYVAATDLLGLQSVLSRSRAIEGAIAPLALANWWLYGAGLGLLMAELQSAHMPIALIIEHKDDPLGVKRILEGVVALLRAGVTMVSLRCDVSGLGLIANGAIAAAFGSRTSLRHLYPNSNGGGPPSGRSESAFWPAGMAMHYSDLLHDAAQATLRDPVWICDCAVCGGKRLDRLGHAIAATVRAHNAESLLEIRRIVVSAPVVDQSRLWRTLCRKAVGVHEAASVGPVVLRSPKALQHWQDV